MDRTDAVVAVVVFIIVIVLISVVMTVKYNCCMSIKQDHDECIYDVGCNS